MPDTKSSSHAEPPVAGPGFGRVAIGGAAVLLAVVSFLPVQTSATGAMGFRWDLPENITPLTIGQLQREPTDWAMGLFAYAPALAAVCGLLAVAAGPRLRGDWAGAGGAMGLLMLFLPLISAVFDDLALAVGALACLVTTGSAAVLGGAVVLSRYRSMSKAVRFGVAALAMICLAAEGVLWLVLSQRPAEAPSLWPAAGGWILWVVAGPLNLAILAALAAAATARGAKWLHAVALVALAATALAALFECRDSCKRNRRMHFSQSFPSALTHGN